MKNRKIVFANQKGGVGKSTLCILFANYLAWKGKEVCIIDTDLQKTILMQRQKDVQLYEGEEEPYNVQDFDVADPETMQQLMDSASQVEGYVLFDSPGNISEDGLAPLFVDADYIICPYEYEDKTLDSTGVFVQVLNALREHNPQMHAQIFFVPNRIDPRIGTTDEQRMWRETDDIFKNYGKVTPVVNSRATLKRTNTFELVATQREAVKSAFEYILKRMK
ncbi:MAG: ParA family protein [Prevotella sp.]|nr:ParA family protein [Prevotella sp.]